MINKDSTYTLSNGIQIPVISYGTWQTPDGEETASSVEQAIKDGYRLIDAASVYKTKKASERESGVLELTVKSFLSPASFGMKTAVMKRRLKLLKIHCVI